MTHTITSNQTSTYSFSPGESGTLTVDAGVYVASAAGPAIYLQPNAEQVASYTIQNQGTLISKPGSPSFELVGVVVGGGLLESLFLSNTGTIEGAQAGISVQTGQSQTIVNSGYIHSSTLGIEALGVTTLTNTGTISAESGAGVVLNGGGTITDSGLIASGGRDPAIVFSQIDGPATSSADSRLILQPGASIQGSVETTLPTGATTLELAGTGGTLSNANFSGSFAVQVDAGASWTLNVDEFVGLTAVTNDGTLSVADNGFQGLAAITTDLGDSGALRIGADATLFVQQGVTGGQVVTIGNDGTLVLGGFGGAVLAGWTAGSVVDLLSLNANGPSLTAIALDGRQTIAVSDGTHTVDMRLTSPLAPDTQVTASQSDFGVELNVTSYAAPDITLAASGTVDMGGTASLAMSLTDGFEQATGGTLGITIGARFGVLIDPSLQASGSGTGTLTVEGTLAQVQAALAELQFAPSADESTDTITATLADNSGGAASASQSVTADAGPQLQLPDAAAAVVGLTVPLSGLQVGDDYLVAAGGTIEVSLTADAGTLLLSQPAQSMATGSTALDPSGTLTLTGSLADVNADLANLVTGADQTGSGTITVSVSDSGGGSACGTIQYQAFADQLSWAASQDGAFASAESWSIDSTPPLLVGPDQHAIVVFATDAATPYQVTGDGSAGAMLVEGDRFVTTGALAIGGSDASVLTVASGQVTIAPTSTITVAGTASIGGAQAASVEVQGGLQAAGIGVGTNGLLTVDSGSSLTGPLELDGGTVAAAPPVGDAPASPVELADGVDLAASTESSVDGAAVGLLIDAGLSGAGSLDLSGQVAIGGSGDASGVLTLHGATLQLNTAQAIGSAEIATAEGTTNEIDLGAAGNAIDSAGADTIRLGDAAAQLSVSGAATVYGGSADATLRATGATVSVIAGTGALLVTGSADAVIDQRSGGVVDYEGSGRVSLVGAGAAAATVTASSGGEITTDTGQTLLTLGSADAMVTSNGTDTIYGGSGAATIFGTGAATQVIGGAGPLVFTGGQGAASVLGGAGSATLFGGAGGGFLQGGNAGGNLLVAGGGNTTLVAAGGADQLFAGAAAATLFGSAVGDDTMVGGQLPSLMVASGSATEFAGSAGGTEMAGGGAATLVGGSGGSTTMVGGSSQTEFVGGAGSIVAFGGAADDRFVLGAGDAIAVEGSGDDTVVFGGGRAEIWGGTGHDSYDVVHGTAGGDAIVVGFKPTLDAVDLFGYHRADASLRAEGGSTVLTLTDGTRIELYGVADAHQVKLSFG